MDAAALQLPEVDAPPGGDLAAALEHFVVRHDDMPPPLCDAVSARVLAAFDEHPRDPDTQYLGLQLINGLCRCQAQDPAAVLRLAHAVWPRLYGDVRQSALHGFLAAFGRAARTGQQTALAFVEGLEGPDFTGAVERLACDVLADPEACDRLHGDEAHRAWRVVFDRGRHGCLPRQRLSELVACTVARSSGLSLRQWVGFIEHANELSPAAQQTLMAASFNALVAMPPAEALALDKAWRTTPMSRDTPFLSSNRTPLLQAFRHAAGRACPGLRLPKAHITREGAREFSGVLHKLGPRLLPVAADTIEAALLPTLLSPSAGERHANESSAAALLDAADQFRPEDRHEVWRLCFLLAPAATLIALAGRLGKPVMSNGHPRWPSLDDAVFPARHGGKSLAWLLRTHPHTRADALAVLRWRIAELPPCQRPGALALLAELGG